MDQPLGTHCFPLAGLAGSQGHSPVVRYMTASEDVTGQAPEPIDMSHNMARQTLQVRS